MRGWSPDRIIPRLSSVAVPGAWGWSGLRPPFLPPRTVARCYITTASLCRFMTAIDRAKLRSEVCIVVRTPEPPIPFQPIPGVVKVVFTGQNSATLWANIMHVAATSTTALNQATVDTLAANFHGFYATRFEALKCNSDHLLQTEVTDLRVDRGKNRDVRSEYHRGARSKPEPGEREPRGGVEHRPTLPGR